MRREEYKGEFLKSPSILKQMERCYFRHPFLIMPPLPEALGYLPDMSESHYGSWNSATVVMSHYHFCDVTFISMLF
jgi:hypothetical protein